MCAADARIRPEARQLRKRGETPGSAAGCNKPATSGDGRTVEVVQNHVDGTLSRTWRSGTSSVATLAWPGPGSMSMEGTYRRIPGESASNIGFRSGNAGQGRGEASKRRRRPRGRGGSGDRSRVGRWEDLEDPEPRGARRRRKPTTAIRANQRSGRRRVRPNEPLPRPRRCHGPEFEHPGRPGACIGRAPRAPKTTPTSWKLPGNGRSRCTSKL
jgi:hypothetical protein